jgi:hypothetical protein
MLSISLGASDLQLCRVLQWSLFEAQNGSGCPVLRDGIHKLVPEMVLSKIILDVGQPVPDAYCTLKQ